MEESENSGEADWQGEIEKLEMECMSPLDGGLVQQLDFPGIGQPLDYVPWVVISGELNKIFGPFGWTDEVVSQQLIGSEEYSSRQGKKNWRASAVVCVRLKILREGVLLTQHDGLASFVAESNLKFTAISNAFKSSQSRALARAAAKVGWRFGAGLWLKCNDARFHGLVTGDDAVLGKKAKGRDRRIYDFGIYSPGQRQAIENRQAPAPQAEQAQPAPRDDAPKVKVWLPDTVAEDLRDECKRVQDDSPVDEDLARRLFRSLAWECVDPGIVPDKEYSFHCAEMAFDQAGIEKRGETFLAAGSARDWFKAACRVRADLIKDKDSARRDGAFENRAEFPFLRGPKAHEFDKFEDTAEKPGAHRFMIYRAITRKERSGWRTILNLVIPDQKVLVGFDLLHGTEPQRRRAFGFLGCLELEGWKQWDLIDHPSKLLGQWGAGHFLGVGGRTVLDKFITRAQQRKAKEAAQTAPAPEETKEEAEQMTEMETAEGIA